MSNLTQERAHMLASDMNHGDEWANSLKVGDEFFGAMYEARRIYPTDEKLQRFFCVGAIEAFKSQKIFTDCYGIITAIE